MPYGLKTEIIAKINSIFAEYEQVQEVILYGSRAKGNYKPGSDIDLTLKGQNLNLKVLNNISLQLDDLMLPYIFDISIYHQINNPDLIDHIKRVGKIFFLRDLETNNTHSTLSSKVEQILG